VYGVEPPCRVVRGATPHGEGAAVTRTREPPHTQGPPHTGATPRMAAPHATPVGEGRPVMQRALSHTNGGAPCHVNALPPVVLCKAHSRMPRHAWGEPLVWGASPTHMGVPSALLYECKAPLV